MNIAELKAGSEIVAEIHAQGLTPVTVQGVLFDFLTLKQLNVEFLAYLRDRAVSDEDQS